MEGSWAIASGQHRAEAVTVPHPHELLGLNPDWPWLSTELETDAGKAVKGAGVRSDEGAVR